MNNRLIAAITIFIATSIALTPYCGWLFDCGCTWPWAGLDADCNNHKPGTLHKCPWCGNYVKGIISSTLAIGSATLIAYMPIKSSFARRMLGGTIAFLVIGFISAWISATLQAYPHFII